MRRRVVLQTVCLLLGAVLCGAAHAQEASGNWPLRPNNPPADGDVGWQRIGSELTALYELYTEHLAESPAQPFPRIPYLVIADDRVVIDTAADGDVAQLVAALAELDAVEIVAFKRVVSARLPLASIPRLAEIESLRFARPARMATHVGSVDSQGDAAQRSDDARTTYGVDGSGKRIGTLSDTFDCGVGTPGDYAGDIGTGDLPAGIEILDDSVACGIDEGRAMMQLIHDVAPGATQSFHTAFTGQAGFALGIEELGGCPPGSEAGCTPAATAADVINDDVFYFAEPFFQDGIIAQAADLVEAAGIPYFASAGNSARSSWEGSFESSGILLPGTGLASPATAHDFDPGPGVDIFHKVSLSGDTGFSLQWDDPFFSVSGPLGAATDLTFCVYADPPPTPPAGTALYCAPDANIGVDPVETIFYTGPATVFNISIGKLNGPDPATMKYLAFNSGFSFVDGYAAISTSTVVGHANSAGAVATGAADYEDTPEFGTTPPLLDSFSSAGGTPILFDIAGTRLASPLVRMKPEIVAPNCTNTTFFGTDDGDPDVFPNFCGTSAAAPHAAAVAILLLEAFPGLTPSAVEDVLASSGIDILPAGFDFDSGYGLIDAHAAVGSVFPGTACDGVADLMLHGTPNSSAGTFSATGSIEYAEGTFGGVTGRAPSHSFADGAVIGDGSSFEGCP